MELFSCLNRNTDGLGDWYEYSSCAKISETVRRGGLTTVQFPTSNPTTITTYSPRYPIRVRCVS
jgi:hypothetical protein